MFILCIDPGLVNLGYSYVNTSTCQGLTIIKRNKVDLIMPGKTISDGVDKWISDDPDIFKYSYKIVIERQPPTGAALVVQELLYSKFKEKVILLHPSTVAKYFGTIKCTYKDRKKANRIYANQYFNIQESSFDICDSLCLSVYYFENIANKDTIFENFRCRIRKNPFEKFNYKNKNT